MRPYDVMQNRVEREGGMAPTVSLFGIFTSLPSHGREFLVIGGEFTDCLAQRFFIARVNNDAGTAMFDE
jgi:hypothetical protein